MNRRILVFANQKGGIGKTTLCRELGIYCASQGFKVLFVDCDPQGNLTRGLVEEEEGFLGGLYEALTGEEVSLETLTENITLLGGDFRLSGLEKSLVGEIDAYARLRELLATPVFKAFDLVFLDTPPSLGILTGNALSAAGHIVIPVKPALYSLQGTNDLMGSIAKVRKQLNPDLDILGVIVNAYESTPVITRQIRQEIEEGFGDKVFSTVLSKTVKIEEAIAEKKGVIHLKKLDRSRARDEVCRIGRELLGRLDKEAPHG